MPLTRISLRRGKPAAYRQAVLEGLYQAMRETFDVPEGDRFMTISEHDADDFSYGADYLGIHRSDDLVIIQITVSNTRSVAQKQLLYRRIVEKLTANPGIRPEDVFINLLEVLPENWSFGHGEAQYVR
jgi:4-oxalocrotonate tautomerase